MTIWTAWEAPGRQERTNWTACEAPGRHQGGRRAEAPGRHQGGRRALKGNPVLRDSPSMARLSKNGVWGNNLYQGQS